MTGSMQYFDFYFSNSKNITIAGTYNFIICLGCWSVYDLGSCFFCQINVTGNKICVKMCFKNVLYGCISAFRLFNIGSGFAQRINNGSLSIRFYIVSSLR